MGLGEGTGWEGISRPGLHALLWPCVQRGPGGRMSLARMRREGMSVAKI